MQGFRLWLNGNLVGDVADSEYQLDTDTLTEGQTYTLSVAAIYSDGVSEAVTESFRFFNCGHVENPIDLQGRFTESGDVMLEWVASYGPLVKSDRYNSWTPEYITHPKAGYNNGWDVSALHDGLTAYGFNADHADGMKIADKFTINNEYPYCPGLSFYVYQGPTPTSTITAAYFAVYDGDPSNGGNLIFGSENESDIFPIETFLAEAYRTGENDFSDVERPVFVVRVWADTFFETLPEGDYWFTVSFEGSLDESVFVVPRTILGQTETGEAKIYNPYGTCYVNNVSVSEDVKDDALLHPNPANSKVYLNRKADVVRIFDVNGRLVLSAENTDTFDVSSLADGVYAVLIDNVMQRLVVK